MKLSPTVKEKINQIISSLKKYKIPGTLYIEGSYTTETNDQYSDIDLAFVVNKKDYNTIATQIGNILRSLNKPLYILEYGENQKFPGYYYFLAMYNDLGPFQIIDLCILDKNKKQYRGKRKALYKQKNVKNILADKLKPTDKLTKKQKEILKFYFLQPGLVKKIIRKEPEKILKKAFELKLINQIKPYCSNQDLKNISMLIKRNKWDKAFNEGLKIFNLKTKKYQPKNNNFNRLKNRVEKLAKLL